MIDLVDGKECKHIYRTRVRKHYEWLVGRSSLADEQGKHCEIIGNVHENPELLKEENT